MIFSRTVALSALVLTCSQQAFASDAHERWTLRIETEGNTAEWIYSHSTDSEGTFGGSSDEQVKWIVQYNDDKRVTSIDGPEPGPTDRTEMNWAADGNSVGVVFPTHTATYFFDDLGRLTQKASSDGQNLHIVYKTNTPESGDILEGFQSILFQNTATGVSKSWDFTYNEEESPFEGLEFPFAIATQEQIYNFTSDSEGYRRVYQDALSLAIGIRSEFMPARIIQPPAKLRSGGVAINVDTPDGTSDLSPLQNNIGLTCQIVVERDSDLEDEVDTTFVVPCDSSPSPSFGGSSISYGGYLGGGVSYQGASAFQQMQFIYPMPHKYETDNVVCEDASLITEDQLRALIKKYTVPTHTPAPVESGSRNIAISPGYITSVGSYNVHLVGGPVLTTFSEDGMVGTNTTTREHIMHFGRVERFFEVVEGRLTMQTIGTGVNRNQILATINEQSGPTIFNDLDALLQEELESMEEGCRE